MATRDKELRAACALLGLSDGDVTHLAFREQELAEAGAEFVDAVADAVRRNLACRRPVNLGVRPSP